jgi:LSD1 subclass zinc finger protein
VLVRNATHTKQAYSLTQYLSCRRLLGYVRKALHLRCRALQVLEARNRLVGALCTAIRGCDCLYALGNRFVLFYSNL